MGHSRYSPGLLFQDETSGRHKLLTMDVPVTMVPLGRTTAETQAAAIRAAMNRVPDLDAQLSAYPQHLRLACIDRYSANIRAEDHFKCMQPEMTRTILPCDVHKASTVIKKALRPFEEVTSGLVHTGLSMEGGGALQVMRQILQQIFRDELRIDYSAPPGGGAVRTHTEQILELFCPTHDGSSSQLKNMRRQFVLQYYCNSDIRESEIIHHCTFSCCADPQDTVEKFTQWVVFALLPRKCAVLKRKSWNGAEVPLEWTGLLASFWNLFAKVMVKFTGSARTRVTSGVDEDEEEHEEVRRAPAVHDEDMGLVQGLLAESEPRAAGQDDFVDAERLVGPDGEVDWRALQVQRKRKAGVFACRETLMEMLGLVAAGCCCWVLVGGAASPFPCQFVCALVVGLPTMAPYYRPLTLAAAVLRKLVTARHVLEPGRLLMCMLLNVSSQHWELQQQRQAQRGEARTYRILEAARGNMLQIVVEKIRAHLGSLPSGLPVSCYKRRARTLLFCGLSAALCNLEGYMGRSHRGFPYALFRAMDSETDKQELLDRPCCMRDEFSHKFLEEYPTPLAMASARAQAVLETVGLLADTDVAAVEAGHASVREYTMQRGRGHVPTLSEVSAKSFCRWMHMHHGKPPDAAADAAQRETKAGLYAR